MIPEKEFQELLKQFSENKASETQLARYFSSLTQERDFSDIPYKELAIIKKQLLAVVGTAIKQDKKVTTALNVLFSTCKISYYYGKMFAEKNNNAALVKFFDDFEKKLSWRDLITIFVDFNNSEDEKKYYLGLMEERIKKNKNSFKEQLRGINDGMLNTFLQTIASYDKDQLLSLVLDVIPRKRIEGLTFDFKTNEKIQYEIPQEQSFIDVEEIDKLDFQGLIIAKNAVKCVKVMLQNGFSFDQLHAKLLPPFIIALLFKRDAIVDLINDARKLKIPNDHERHIADNYLVIASLIYPVAKLQEILKQQPKFKEFLSENAFLHILTMASVNNLVYLMPMKQFKTENEAKYLLFAIKKIIKEGNLEHKIAVVQYVQTLMQQKSGLTKFIDKNADLLSEIMSLTIFLVNLLSEKKIQDMQPIMQAMSGSYAVPNNLELSQAVRALDQSKVQTYNDIGNDNASLEQRFNSQFTMRDSQAPINITYYDSKKEIELYTNLFTALYYSSDKSDLTKEYPVQNMDINIFTMALMAKLDDVVEHMITVRQVPVENMHVMLFCRQGRDKLLQHVLETQSGFNLFDFSSEGYTALDYAVLNNQITCVDSILKFLLKDQKNAAFGDLDKYIQRAFKLATDEQVEIKALLLERLTNDETRAKTKEKNSYNLVLKKLEQPTVAAIENNNDNAINFNFTDKNGKACVAHISPEQYSLLQTKKGNVFDKVFSFIKDYGIFGYRMKEVKLTDGKMSYKIRPTGIFGNTRIHLVEKNVDANGVVHYDSYLKNHDTRKMMQPK